MCLNRNKILCGDAYEKIKEIPDDSIDCVITSPPYWGLRDYGVSGQIGLEKSPEEYLEKLFSLFDDIYRAAKPTATIWVNLADSYAGSCKGQGGEINSPKQQSNKGSYFGNPLRTLLKGVPNKSMCCIPFRFAWGMVQRGWILRQDIIWAKPNPMPESVKDRCTRAHEYVFMFTKSRNYFYDWFAVREPAASNNSAIAPKHHGQPTAYSAYRNRRSVWNISTKGFKGAHFATFPPDLIEPMILAGCPEWVCAACGKPRERILKPTEEYAKKLVGSWSRRTDEDAAVRLREGFQTDDKPDSCCSDYITDGWTDCGCGAGWQRGIVLDPFMGSGTVAEVAYKAGRDYLGIELNPEYIELAHSRIEKFCLFERENYV